MNRPFLSGGRAILIPVLIAELVYLFFLRSFLEKGSLFQAAPWLQSLLMLEKTSSHGPAQFLAVGDLCALFFVPWLAFLSWLARRNHEGLTGNRTLLFVIAASALLIKGSLVMAPLSALKSWPWIDDSFYYFNIARNLAEGRGLMHDSFSTTTGFQPLFLCLITPLFHCFGPAGAVKAVLLFQSLISLFQGWALYRLVKQLTGSPSAALCAFFIQSFSARWTGMDLNGLETGLALGLEWVALERYLALRTRGIAGAGPSTIGLVGLLLGLSFLARVDAALLGLALAVDLILFQRTITPSRRFRALLLIGLPAAATALPWLLFVLWREGALMPSSGEAIRFLSLSNGFQHLRGHIQPFDLPAPPMAYYAETFGLACTRILENMNAVVPFLLGLPTIGLALILAPRQGLRLMSSLCPLLFFAAFLIPAYSFWILGQWFFPRYLFPVTLPYVILFSYSTVILLRRLKSGPRFPLMVQAGVLAAGLLLTLPLVIRVKGTFLRQEPIVYEKVARWMNESLPAGTVVGVFQSGIIGYDLKLPFVGLDGKINRGALRAMQADTVDRFAMRLGVRFVADWPFVLQTLWTRHARDTTLLKGKPVAEISGFEVYALPPAGAGNQLRP